MTNNNRKNCHTIFKNCCSNLDPRKSIFKFLFCSCFFEMMIKHWCPQGSVAKLISYAIRSDMKILKLSNLIYFIWYTLLHFGFIFKDVNKFLKRILKWRAKRATFSIFFFFFGTKIIFIIWILFGTLIKWDIFNHCDM